MCLRFCSSSCSNTHVVKFVKFAIEGWKPKGPELILTYEVLVAWLAFDFAGS